MLMSAAKNAQASSGDDNLLIHPSMLGLPQIPAVDTGSLKGLMIFLTAATLTH